MSNGRARLEQIAAGCSAEVALQHFAVAASSLDEERNVAFIDRLLQDDEEAVVIAEETARFAEEHTIYSSFFAKVRTTETEYLALTPRSSAQTDAALEHEKKLLTVVVDAPRTCVEARTIAARVQNSFVDLADHFFIRTLDRYAQHISNRGVAGSLTKLGGVRLIFPRELATTNTPIVIAAPSELYMRGIAGNALRPGGPPILFSIASRDPVTANTFYAVGRGAVSSSASRIRAHIDGAFWEFTQYVRMHVKESDVLRVEVT